MIKAENILIQSLLERNQTLALAESCTGGLIGHKLTNIPGSSGVLLMGIVAYSNQAKQRILGVSKDILEQKGSVSKETVKAMSNGVRTKSKSDYAIAVTGIAGPTGGTADKPIGLVYISVSTPKKTIVRKCFFEGTRLQVKKQTAETAINLLLQLL